MIPGPALLAAASVVAGAGDAAGAPPPAAPGYLPEQECAGCHRTLYNAYQHVSMGRSFLRARPDNLLADFERNHLFHAASRRHYVMSLRDGGVTMVRYQLDDTGQRVNVIEQPVDWIIGSGEHARSYAFQNEAGEIFLLPVSWYTRSASWGMTPGFDNARHSGLRRQVVRECLFCHASYPDVPAGHDHFGKLQVFPRELPEGIGCQRCHGPGAEHVRLANDLDAANDAVRDSIVNPARLSPELRDDVCLQCHLLTTSSRQTSTIRRFGRGAYSYRPGEPLDEYAVYMDFVFLQAGDDDRIEVDHQPYRMHQSTCYRESGGRLSCLTCHDPHRRPPADRSAYYRDRCLSCHGLDDCALEAMGDDCIACHMPKRRAHDAVHVVVTDHGIPRRVPDDPLADLQEQPAPVVAEVRWYWPHRAPREPEASVYRALAATETASPLALDELAEVIAATAPEDIDPYLRLGAAQLVSGRHEHAFETFASVVERWPASATARAAAGTALCRLERNEEALSYLEAAIELAPRNPQAHFDRATALARLDRLDEARRAYEEALRLRPTYADAWFSLGDVHARVQRLNEAAVAYRRALSIEPNLPLASRNLGWVLCRAGRWREGINAWRHGARLSPEHPDLALDLALAYLLAAPPPLRSAADGLRFAQAASEVAVARHHRSGAALAVALGLYRTGKFEDSIVEADRAGVLGADPAACHFLVALARLELGRTGLAEESYRRGREANAREPFKDPIRSALKLEAAKAFSNAARGNRKPNR